MGGPLNPEELDVLLGAYALDAIDDPDERAQVEAWLARSPNARRDAEELRETAALLAQTAVDPPEDLWERIEARVVGTEGGEPPPLHVPGVIDARGRARRPWLVGVAAALGLAVAVSIGVAVGHEISDQDARIDRLAAGMEGDAMERAALAAAMEPDARTARLESPDGAVLASVVTTADGRGYFVAERMPTLPAGRTYQLWALMGKEPGAPVVSVGVLGRDPTVMGFNAGGDVMGFVVTEEDAPGATVSTTPPMVEGWLA